MEDRRHPRRATSHSAGGGAHRRPGTGPSGVAPVRQRAPLPARADNLPPLPPEYHADLDAGLKQMGLGLARWQRRLIDDHARLLLAWNAAVNLTAITDPRGIALSHVLDSLSATAPIRATGARSLLDLGSGGGYPGIPLAAILPLHRVVLVESVGKKARFLETVAAADGLTGRVTVAAERAESLARQDVHRERWDVVIARAVGALAELVELGFPLLVRGGLLVAWKRGELDWELAQARRALTGLGGGTIDVHPAGIDQLPGHRLLLLRRTGPVATRYPRDRRVRKREPW